MPLYEYQCQNCGRTLEKRQKFSDPELTECPHCGGRLEKLLSAPAVQFKGGGWYADL
jgi:putative FmdB family regulatory protein